MSHFTVMVITNEEPTDAVLKETLMPFHEYECTGIERFLVDVDVTDKVAAYYNEPQKVIVLADGSVHHRYDNKFYTVESANEFDRKLGRKEFALPEGAVEKEMTADEARPHGIGSKTLREAAEAYYGEDIVERSGRFYNRTNPNKKWDWYSRGGRWQGMLVPRTGRFANLDVGLTPPVKAYVGRPGVFDNGAMRPNGVDSLQVKDLDLEFVRDDAEQKAAIKYDQVHAVIAGRTLETMDDICKRRGFENWQALCDASTTEAPKGDIIEQVRDAYWKQQIIQDLRKQDLCVWDGPDEFMVPREQYLARARQTALQTFAVLKDGQWYEKGEMGWFAFVSGDKGTAWSEEYAKLLDGLPPETWLTVVDCHI